jgi:hypothetical protein
LAFLAAVAGVSLRWVAEKRLADQAEVVRYETAYILTRPLLRFRGWDLVDESIFTLEQQGWERVARQQLADPKTGERKSLLHVVLRGRASVLWLAPIEIEYGDGLYNYEFITEFLMCIQEHDWPYRIYDIRPELEMRESRAGRKDDQRPAARPGLAPTRPHESVR